MKIDAEQLSRAVAAYCKDTGRQFSVADDGKIRIFDGTPGADDRVLWLEDGALRGNDIDFTLSFAEEYIRPSTLPVNERSHEDKVIMPASQKRPSSSPLVKSGAIRDVQVSDLSLADIKEYICPSATDQEAFMFLKLCQARNLNPFLKEAYLIKYGGGPATIVVGKDAFTRRAEEHPQFDGFRAGIIVCTGEDRKLEWREGTFLMKGEELVGAWAEVFRKDRSHPFKSAVSRAEYDTGKSNWQRMPATMLRKVSLVQALREGFASEFSGMYDQSEMGQTIDVEFEEA